MVKRKRILSSILAVILGLGMCPASVRAEDNPLELNVISNSVTKECEEFAQEIVGQHIETFYGIAREEGTNISETEPYYLGTGFHAYSYMDGNLVEKTEIVYFPVIQNDEVIFILSVAETKDDFSATSSSNFSELMNETTGRFMIVYTGDDADEEGYFVTDDSNIQFYDSNPQTEYPLGEWSLDDMDKSRADEQAYPVEKIYNVGVVESPISGAMPRMDGFSVYEDDYKLLEMSGCMIGQGPYGLCWAATTGTMIRYKTGDRTVSAQYIADLLGIGYNDGGTNFDCLTALRLYGADDSYRAVNRPASSFTEVQHNINNRFPMYMGGGRYEGSVRVAGHAVTVIGYNGNLILFWNPASEEMAATTYRGASTNFATGSNVYYWESSTMATL